MNDNDLLVKAIKQSELSVEQGNFPAGAVVADRNGNILSEGISDTYPGYQHAECRALDDAFRSHGLLNECVLFASMEPCLMCLTRAYWAGIRSIIFAIDKGKVDIHYYEGNIPITKVSDGFNESLSLHHLDGFQDKALKVVRKWEARL